MSVNILNNVMSQKHKSVISSDDDDYELPSLSERIKVSLKPLHNIDTVHISGAKENSESEDEEFQKFSEKIRITPYSQIKSKGTCGIKNDGTKSLKFSEKIHTPHLNMKLNFSSTSASENEESAMPIFSEKIQSIPQPQFIGKYLETSESDGDEIFSSKMLQEICTPRIKNKENCYTPNDSDSDEVFSNITKKMHEFRTPLSQNRMNCNKADESSSDESFSKFVEKLRTPIPMKRMSHNKAVGLNGDNSLLNTVERLSAFHTPKSQRKVERKDYPDRKVHCCSINAVQEEDDASDSLQISENKQEFTVLFPSETVNSTFLQNRTKHTRKLFEFFNRKIFNSQLPKDMPLIWDGSLVKTAGLTSCTFKNNIYSCSIKLSSELLNSFDRLKNTLLHEMCHAAVWIINKQRKVQHGPLWQIWASRCKLILPFVECPQRCHTYEVSYRVWYRCTKCNWKKGRCRQVKKYEGSVCKKCKTPITMTYV